MKALSIMQPWALLIAYGFKDIENRDWPTSFRGRFLIHAGKKFDGPKTEWEFPGIPRPDHFDMGGIIGEAEIVDCVSKSGSEWFHGRYGFVIRNARPLPFRPYRGQLGFFEVEDAVPLALLETEKEQTP